MNPVDKPALYIFHHIFTSALDRRVGQQHNSKEKPQSNSPTKTDSKHKWKTGEFSVKIMGSNDFEKNTDYPRDDSKMYPA